jgi:hypothetical protein
VANVGFTSDAAMFTGDAAMFTGDAAIPWRRDHTLSRAVTLTADATNEAIEVVLRQVGAKIECTVTWLDEEAAPYDLRSVSLHRAKHEIKAWLARDGFVPVDRWSAVGADGNQVMRHFRRPPANDRLAPLVR